MEFSAQPVKSIMEQVVNDIIIFDIKLWKKEVNLVFNLLIINQKKHKNVHNFSFKLEHTIKYQMHNY